MQKTRLVAAAAVAALAFAAGASAQQAPKWIGAAPSHRSFERYDMSVGVTAGQQPRRPVRIDEEREVFSVPAHYGELVATTGDAHATVFWFRDAGGALRNAVVEEPAKRVYKVQQTPTARYEADAREQ